MTRILEYLERIDRDGSALHLCMRCGHCLGGADQDPKSQAGTYDAPIGAGQPASRNVDSGNWVLRHFVCPACGVLFDMDMLPKGEPSPTSVRLA